MPQERARVARISGFPYAAVGVVVIVLAIISILPMFPTSKPRMTFTWTTRRRGFHTPSRGAPTLRDGCHCSISIRCRSGWRFSFFINYVTSQVPEIPSTLDAAVQNSPDLLEALAGQLLKFARLELLLSATKAPPIWFRWACFFFWCRLVFGTGLLKFAAHKLLGLYGAINTVLCLLIF